MRRLSAWAVILSALAASLATPVLAASSQAPVFFRDSEVEDSLRAMAAPLLLKAGLEPGSVSIRVVLSPSVNVYTAPERTLVLTSAVVMGQPPEKVAALLAHGVAHLAHGDMPTLANHRETDEKTTISGIRTLAGLTMIGLTVLSRGDGAESSKAINSYMVADPFPVEYPIYNSGQEAAADRDALRLLADLRWPVRGLVSVFQDGGGQDQRPDDHQSAFVRTHRLTDDRIGAMRNEAELLVADDGPLPGEVSERLSWAAEKMSALLDPPEKTLMRDRADKSDRAARYGRAIALARQNDLPASLSLLDGLLAEDPSSPFLRQARGRVLFTHADVRAALQDYRSASDMRPDDALLALDWASAANEQADVPAIRAVIPRLEEILSRVAEPDTAGPLWAALGVAYGKCGDDVMASYALAEEALLKGEKSKAAYLGAKAARAMAHSDRHWRRAREITELASAGR